MRYIILAAFCFGVNSEVLRPGLGGTIGVEIVRTAIGPIEDNGDDISERKKSSRLYCNSLNDNEEDVTNKENFVFPCNNNNIACVREFMANNSICSPVFGPAPEPLCIAQNTAFIVSSNITITYSDFEVSGLNGASINSFYFNKKTGWLILSIMLPSLTVSTSRKHFQYRRAGYEPIDRSDRSIVTYNKVIITAEIPGQCGNLLLSLADIHVYVGDAYPNFYIGPNVYNSTDPTVREGYATILDNVPIATREMLLFQAPFFMASYIQSNICDFGVELYSV